MTFDGIGIARRLAKKQSRQSRRGFVGLLSRFGFAAIGAVSVAGMKSRSALSACGINFSTGGTSGTTTAITLLNCRSEPFARSYATIQSFVNCNTTVNKVRYTDGGDAVTNRCGATRNRWYLVEDPLGYVDYCWIAGGYTTTYSGGCGVCCSCDALESEPAG